MPLLSVRRLKVGGTQDHGVPSTHHRPRMTAKIAIAPYEHSAYESLPSLGDANDSFKARNAHTAIYGELKDVLVKHGVTDQFGLALLHSHAGLLPHERLVHFGNSAVPVSVNETPPSMLFPCTWTFGRDAIFPLEFYFSAGNSLPALKQP